MEEDTITPVHGSTYMISSIPITKLRQLYTEPANGSDSRGKGNAIIEPVPVKMEIRSVNTRKFPEEVELRAVVFDSAGRYITGLAPPYYQGNDNYKKYWKSLSDSCKGNIFLIDTFDVIEVQSQSSEPHAISFVLDHSPSMGHVRALKLQQAVRKVLQDVKRSDYISVIKFSSKIFYEVRMTDDQNIYSKSIIVDGLKGKYGTGTAIYNAAMAGIQESMRAPGSNKRVIILFTDGVDNSSNITIDSMLKYAKARDITIYTIAYGQADKEPMKRIAESTGGKFYQLHTSRDFSYVFADIYLSLNNYYKIRYSPPDCKDYHSASVRISLPEADQPEIVTWIDYDKTVFTKDDTVGTMTFINIEFEYGKSDIMPESLPLIEDVARAMKNNPGLKISVVGHTDDIGSDEFNLKLSYERARSVIQKLVEMGINKERLESAGLGESKPLVPNTNDENRKRNRRTEFLITAN